MLFTCRWSKTGGEPGRRFFPAVLLWPHSQQPIRDQCSHADGGIGGTFSLHHWHDMYVTNGSWCYLIMLFTCVTTIECLPLHWGQKQLSALNVKFPPSFNHFLVHCPFFSPLFILFSKISLNFPHLPNFPLLICLVALYVSTCPTPTPPSSLSLSLSLSVKINPAVTVHWSADELRWSA